MAEDVKVTPRMPKGTPEWAKGLAIVVGAVSLFFLTAYPLMKSEVQDYLKYASLQQQASIDTALNTSQGNREQLNVLSGVLDYMVKENAKISARVLLLEVEMKKSKEDLNVCEIQLRECVKKGIKPTS